MIPILKKTPCFVVFPALAGDKRQTGPMAGRGMDKRAARSAQRCQEKILYIYGR